jgi:choline-sulfatase
VTDRGNVLWIYSDELRTDAVSSYGNRHVAVETPNIERIGTSGVVFDRFYVSSPVCVSSRYAMKTGLRPARTGVYHNAAVFLDDGVRRPTFTATLASQGWRVADFGKGHVPASLQAFPEHDPEGAQQLALMQAVAALDADRAGVVQRGGTGAGLGVLAATWPPDRPYPPAQVTEHVRRFLREVAASGEPFLCRASYLQPHTPVVVPEPWASRYDDAPWPDEVEPEPGLSRFERRYGEECGLASFDPTQLVAVQARYHGLVSWVDAQVGALLDELDRCGLAERTAVVFCSDHGALLGDYGGAMGKQTFAPASQRVPLLVSWPGTLAPGRRSDLAEGVDLGPTVLGLVGAEADHEVDGRDLFADPEPEAIYAMIGYGNTGARAAAMVGVGSYLGGRGWPQRACVRSGPWRLDRNTRIDGAVVTAEDRDTFLCNTDLDPLERVNLAGTAEHAAPQAHLDALLDEHVAGAVVVPDEAHAELVARLDAMRAAALDRGA